MLAINNPPEAEEPALVIYICDWRKVLCSSRTDVFDKSLETNESWLVEFQDSGVSALLSVAISSLK